MWQMMLVLVIVFALAIVVPKMARSQSMDESMVSDEAAMSSTLDENIGSETVDEDLDMESMDDSMRGNEAPLTPLD